LTPGRKIFWGPFVVWIYCFEKSIPFNVRMSIYGPQEKSSRILSAAAIIARFRERRSLSEDGIRVFSCYETLLDIIGDSVTAVEICGLLGVPEANVRSCAGEIVDLLLFNRANDPYLSLGLRRDTPLAAVNRRWKSLLLLYHPDKYPNRRNYEERSKKINESYERIRSAKEQPTLHQRPAQVREVKVRNRAGTRKIRRFRHLRYLPDFILAIAVITAVISALIFIGIPRHPDAQSQRSGQTVSAPK
jgi:DnaJ-domain-containing protein 1